MGSWTVFMAAKQAFSRAMLVMAAFLMLVSPSASTVDEQDIARDLANPFSRLLNIVNQINSNQLKGGEFRDSHTQFNWNLQPVMPIPFNGQFSIVNRQVFPYYSNPYLDETGEIAFASGLGDIQLASVLVSNNSEGFFYEFGVTFIAPTAKDSVHIVQGLWQAGLAASGIHFQIDIYLCDSVILRQEGVKAFREV
jgi:hypothetical protein